MRLSGARWRRQVAQPASAAQRPHMPTPKPSTPPVSCSRALRAGGRRRAGQAYHRRRRARGQRGSQCGLPAQGCVSIGGRVGAEGGGRAGRQPAVQPAPQNPALQAAQQAAAWALFGTRAPHPPLHPPGLSKPLQTAWSCPAAPSLQTWPSSGWRAPSPAPCPACPRPTPGWRRAPRALWWATETPTGPMPWTPPAPSGACRPAPPAVRVPPLPAARRRHCAAVCVRPSCADSRHAVLASPARSIATVKVLDGCPTPFTDTICAGVTGNQVSAAPRGLQPSCRPAACASTRLGPGARTPAAQPACTRGALAPPAPRRSAPATLAARC